MANWYFRRILTTSERRGQFNQKTWKIIPIKIKHIFSRFIHHRKKEEEVSYSGSFTTWAEAESQSEGYDQKNIFQKNLSALEQIMVGNKKCEKDTILYDDYQYSLPTILGINFAANQDNKPIYVLDYGGGFASSYFRNFGILKKFNLNWTVVEQDHIVEIGNQKFKGVDQISFLTRSLLQERYDDFSFHLVLLGSSIQFFANPSKILGSFSSQSLKSIVVEQTPFVENGSSKITIQNVREPVYEASYPVWHFNEVEFRSWIDPLFETEYRMVNPHVCNSCTGFTSHLIDFVFVNKSS